MLAATTVCGRLHGLSSDQPKSCRSTSAGRSRDAQPYEKQSAQQVAYLVQATQLTMHALPLCNSVCNLQLQPMVVVVHI